MTTNNDNQPEDKAPTFKKYQEVWVKAEFVTTVSDDSRAVKFRDCEDNAHIIFMDEEDVRFTEPTHSTAVIELIEPDRTRIFKKGDKVKRREELLYGRTLDSLSPLLPHGETLIVETDEDSDGEVGIFYGGITRYVPFFILDLVEPAPEAKYWLHESTKTYSIYYRGEYDKINAAMILRKNLYTLEEAQEQLDKLIQKDQDND